MIWILDGQHAFLYISLETFFQEANQKEESMKIFYCLLVLVIFVVPQSLLTAQDSVRTWTGVIDNNFENTLNWIPNGPPENTHVIIPPASLHPVLSTVLFDSVRSVNILTGGQLDIALAGQLNTRDSIRIDSSGTLLVTSTHANPVNIGGKSVIGGTFDISQTVGGTMYFNGKLVILSTGTLHMRGTVQIPNIRDDVILNGQMTIDSTVVALVWCRGNWVRGAGSIFNAGNSRFTFTNPSRSLRIGQGPFYDLTMGPGLTDTLVETNAVYTITLLSPVVMRRGDTLTVNNWRANAIVLDTLTRIIRGSIRRAISSSDTGKYLFHHQYTSVKFESVGTRPQFVTVTEFPDSSLVPNIEVRRLYDIGREGGGVFSAGLTLHYEQSEVRPGTNESLLQLYRTTNNGQSWIFVGGTADSVNNFVRDTITGFSKWQFATPNGPLTVPSIENVIVQQFRLYPNYPNPFNPSTEIRFAISEPSKVSLAVYTVLGQLVTTLVDEKLHGGLYTVPWDGKNALGRPVATGLYFYKIIVLPLQGNGVGFQQVRKMILLK